MYISILGKTVLSDSLKMLDKHSKAKKPNLTPNEKRNAFLKVKFCEKNKAIILFGPGVKLPTTA